MVSANPPNQNAASGRSQSGLSLATVLVIALVCMLWLDGMFAAVLPSFNRVREVKIKTALRSASEAAMDWATADLSNNDPMGLDPGPQISAAKTSNVPQDVVGNTGLPITATVNVENICPSYATSPSYLQGNPNSYLYSQSLDKDLNNNNGLNNWRLVTTTATTANRNSSIRCVLKPTATAPAPSGWVWGAVSAGRGFTQMSKNAVDWYYSDEPWRTGGAGQYSTSANNWDPGNEAHIAVGLAGTPAGDDSIFFSGAGNVGGQLRYMQGAFVSGSPTTLGTTSAFAGNTYPEPPSHPSGAMLLSTITGNYTFASPGNYYFTGNSTAISGGPINIPSSATPDNPVRLFIENTASSVISLNGKNGVINNNGRPGALQIYVKGNGSITIGGNGEFRGVLYAPNSNITIGGSGSVNGAVVGNYVTFTSMTNGLHYDASLKQSKSLAFPSNNQAGQYEVVSWQEMQ